MCDLSPRRLTAARRETAGKISGRKSVLLCGHRPRYGAAGAGVAVAPGVGATLTNVQLCKSAWLCPSCAQWLARARADALRPQIERLTAAGGVPLLITLTVRRERGQALADLLTGIAGAWRAVLSGRRGQAIRAAAGGLSYARGVDIVWSQATGWGPHVHLAVVLHRPTGDPVAVGGQIVDRWLTALERRGLSATAAGQDVLRVADPGEAAAYATKGGSRSARWDAVAEATGGALKISNAGSLSIWQLIDRARAGDRQAVALVAEFAEATHGRRQTTVSRDLTLRADDELDPDEPTADVVATIRTATLRKTAPSVVAALLDRVDAAVAGAGQNWLSAVIETLTHALGPPGDRWYLATGGP